jgi:Arc/MetJ-type ribon-helix-helix transcriptional regulator
MADMNLDEHTMRRIQEKVESGEYADTDDVIKHALDALDDTELSNGELRTLFEPAIMQLDRVEGIPAEDVLAELKFRHRDKRCRKGE